MIPSLVVYRTIRIIYPSSLRHHMALGTLRVDIRLWRLGRSLHRNKAMASASARAANVSQTQRIAI
jgi:hypothetical protein